MQYGGADHLSVAVEIEDPSIVPGHQHTSKAIQRVKINQSLIREQSIVTISNPDGNNFIMNIQNPFNSQLWQSAQISTTASASTFQNAISGYYGMVWGAPISVSKQMLDASGNITSNQSAAVKNVYTITVLRSITQASTNYVNFQKISTHSAISYTLPRSVHLSSPPLKGSFFLTCALPDGTLVNTVDIGVKN